MTGVQTCALPISINAIAAARIFLFGSRDVWFVVGLPVFLYANGWKYIEVAGFIAAWTIGYGFVQAVAPSVVRRSPDGLSREIPEARLWGALLTIIPAVLAVLVQAHVSSNPALLVVGNTALWLALLAGTLMFAHAELRWTTTVVVAGILFLFVDRKSVV